MPTNRPRMNPTARRISNVLRKAKELVREVSQGRWKKVVRGAVDWSNFPFDRFETACAVFMDESTLLRVRNRGMLTLEFMLKMPTDVDEAQDDVLDMMRSDAIDVFTGLAACNEHDPDEPDRPLTMLVDARTDSAIEVSDASLKIQGLVATVYIEI